MSIDTQSGPATPAGPAWRRSEPVIVGHTSQLVRERDFVTHDASGTPLVVVRQADGSLRAFLNVCRHRGVRVVNSPCGNQRSFSCPYHGWTYGPDGALKGIPFRQAFDEINRDDRSLTSVPAVAHEGVVWVLPTPGADLDPPSSRLETVLRERRVADAHFRGRGQWVLGSPVAEVAGRFRDSLGLDGHVHELSSSTSLAQAEGSLVLLSAYSRPGTQDSTIEMIWLGDAPSGPDEIPLAHHLDPWPNTRAALAELAEL